MSNATTRDLAEPVYGFVVGMIARFEQKVEKKENECRVLPARANVRKGLTTWATLTTTVKTMAWRLRLLIASGAFC